MNKTFFRYLALFLILTISTFTLSGCYNIYNIDQLAYVVALGIDVGENNLLKVSFQISSSSGTSGQYGSSQADDAIVNTIECSSIESGINIINSYLSKEVNLSHCKVIVFSEKIAYNGLSKYLYTLMNDIQIRPDCNIIISRCSVDYFLDNSKPILEKLSAKYYEIAPTTSEYTGYTENVTLGDFLCALTNTYANPVAILGGINTPATHSTDQGISGYEKDSSYLANQTTIMAEPNIETLGLAVFKDDSLVGELNAIETVCHMILTNQLNRCRISIPSPFEEGDSIDLSLNLKNKTKYNVKFVNDSPYITIKTSFESRILSISNHSEYLDSANIALIEQYANSYLKGQLYSYLDKTAKEFGTDIDGFGKKAMKYFLTWEEWKNYNWLGNYTNSFFDVDVDVTVLSGLLIEQT